MGLPLRVVSSARDEGLLFCRGADRLHESGHNPLGVGASVLSLPRLAASRQAWAGGRSPFGALLGRRQRLTRSAGDKDRGSDGEISVITKNSSVAFALFGEEPKKG